MEQSQRDPQRLSALYQYHNAPEVAPAHGLEYDDTNYSSSSDKYPVVQTKHFDTRLNGKYAFNNDRPPRIIFGMKVRTFLMVAAVIVCILVGAAVGGAVGGKSMRENHAAEQVSSTSEGGSITVGASSAASPTQSTYSAATPTYTPLNTCPGANNTKYTSSFANGHSGTVPSTADLNFTLYCDVKSPLATVADASTLSEAFVYSLSDCIEICASLNFQAGNGNCSVAAYDHKGSRPGNCWVGKVEGVKVGWLEAEEGVAVALLQSS